MDERTPHRTLAYFDGRREARLQFADGKLVSRDIRELLNFEEDRQIFAGVFQFFYLRLAIFFGCLGIFMNLFRGEMLDKTLHFWFLAPARREVLLAGKYGAGLIASTVIFAGGALLCFAMMLWPHDPVEVQAYWQSAGMAHAFWYTAAAVLGCVGYGSVFLAAGLLLRNPIIPAAVLLGMGEHQRLPARDPAETERAVLPAIAVPGSAAHRQERSGDHSAAAVPGRARLAPRGDPRPARRDRPGALDRAHRHPPHAGLLRQRRVGRDSPPIHYSRTFSLAK